MSAEDSIEFLDLHPRIIGALRNARIKRMSRVLELSTRDLCTTTKLSLSDVTELVHYISVHYLKGSSQPFTKAVDILGENSKEGLLSMGCTVLDTWLGGGLLTSRLTEIAGVSSAGKTQICLQLALTVQLPRHKGGLDGQAAYICTEDFFPNRRLHQLAEIFAQNHRDLEHSSKFYTDRIFITHCSTAAALEGILERQLPNIIAKQNVRLVIVDSIAALFRSDYDVSQMYARSKSLLSIGMRLKTLAYQHKAVVLLINQVTGAPSSSFPSESMKPSLGETWACQVNTRLMVNRTDPLQDAQCFRSMSVVFAPHLPQSSIHYYIDESGVHGVDVAEFLDSIKTD